MFCEIIFAGCVKYPIFNLPLQYRITKNRSRLLRTEPPAYLLRPGVHLFQRHLRRTITKSVYIAIISRLVGYFLNNYAFHGATRRLPIDPLPGRFPYEHPHTPRIGDNNKSFHNQRRKPQYYFCTRSERGNTGKFDRSIFPVVPLSIVYP